MQEIEEVNIIDEATKERNRAVQNRVTDLDIILGYYLMGLNGYVEGCYYPKE